MRSPHLIGRMVTVIMSVDDPAARATGRLIELEDDGGFAVETADGQRVGGWPALYVHPLDEDPVNTGSQS